MILIITGAIGVGKTTVLRAVVEMLEKDIYGVISERSGGRYFVEDLVTHEKRVLASKEKIGFKVKGYYFNPAALQFVERALQRTGDILVYDEIGHLEMRGIIDIFQYLTEDSLVIVREDILEDVVKKRENYKIVTVTEENREKIVEEIAVLCQDLF